MSHWQPGTTLQNGRYMIAQILGYGGAGVTYRAQDRVENRWVAIKTLNALMQTRADFAKHQERFIQEAFRLAKCSHPHIIRVDNICQERDLWCMVMEYVAGGNLRQYAHSKGGLGEAEALRYIQQIGSALDYVHRQGFLHRDVKPANIMLREKNREAVLIDFGLARGFVQDETGDHTNARTESFAPLEQYKRKAKRGAYTDVYALAATLYYLLTLQLPFPAPIRHQGARLIPPIQYNPGVSEQVNAAILKGMELLPGDRPTSILEWLALFSSAPAPKSVAAKSVIAPAVQPPPIRPREDPTPAPIPPPIETSAPTAHPVYASALGLDYSFLQELLSRGRLREADVETARLLLKLADREKAGWLDRVHVENLLCDDLGTLDRIWLEASSQRFGFTTQARIYQKICPHWEPDAQAWKQFCAQVGWRNNNRLVPYKELSFNLWAPQGHLPALGSTLWGFTGWFPVLGQRLQVCGLLPNA
ncbi:MAG: serine/threonine-protein kinase [Cyanobacteriota bacterium]|jgi:serine/threonine protein kinase